MRICFIHLADDSHCYRVDKINQYTENEIEKKRNRHYGVAALFTVHLFVSLELISRKVVSVMAWRVSSVLGHEGIYQFVAVSKILEDRYRNR